MSMSFKQFLIEQSNPDVVATQASKQLTKAIKILKDKFVDAEGSAKKMFQGDLEAHEMVLQMIRDGDMTGAADTFMDMDTEARHYVDDDTFGAFQRIAGRG